MLEEQHVAFLKVLAGLVILSLMFYHGFFDMEYFINGNTFTEFIKSDNFTKAFILIELIIAAALIFLFINWKKDDRFDYYKEFILIAITGILISFLFVSLRYGLF